MPFDSLWPISLNSWSCVGGGKTSAWKSSLGFRTIQPLVRLTPGDNTQCVGEIAPADWRTITDKAKSTRDLSECRSLRIFRPESCVECNA